MYSPSRLWTGMKGIKMSSANVVKIGGCTEIIDTGGRLDLLKIREEQQKVFR
jgi:hypothetical protein